jgi:hypothetical protein
MRAFVYVLAMITIVVIVPGVLYLAFSLWRNSKGKRTFYDCFSQATFVGWRLFLIVALFSFVVFVILLRL